MTESELAKRERQWAAREAEADAARGLDPEIRPAVVALRAHGLPTWYASGGLQRSPPHVGFRHFPTEAAFEPAVEVRSYTNHLIGCLDELLDDFYRGREPGNERIVSVTPRREIIEIISVGARESQRWTAEFVLRTSAEMKAFAEFLRTQFFVDGPIMKRRRHIDAYRLTDDPLGNSGSASTP